MEFSKVVSQRKMVRTYMDQPVDRSVVERILERGRRGPSAGFSQGVAFLVLEGPEQTGRFWEAASHGDEEGWPEDGVKRAPVLVVPMASKTAYLSRYAEDDKGWTDRDELHWPVAYWTVDAAFASMLILLAAVDEGMGALFFGLETGGYERLGEAFGVPGEWEPIGAIAIGHPAPVDPVRSSRDTRLRKPPDEVVHWGRW